VDQVRVRGAVPFLAAPARRPVGPPPRRPRRTGGSPRRPPWPVPVGRRWLSPAGACSWGSGPQVGGLGTVLFRRRREVPRGAGPTGFGFRRGGHLDETRRGHCLTRVSPHSGRALVRAAPQWSVSVVDRGGSDRWCWLSPERPTTSPLRGCRRRGSPLNQGIRSSARPERLCHRSPLFGRAFFAPPWADRPGTGPAA
jgi:hypothetical protein